MSYLHHIQQSNRYHPAHFIPFMLGDLRLGSVKPGFAKCVPEFSAHFRCDDNALVWAPPVDDRAALTALMEELAADLLAAGIVPYRHGEAYPVSLRDRERPYFLMDRALVPYFGVPAFGQHMNGYVRRDGALHLWVARRAADRRHAAGKLDNLVAGGLPWGLSLEENLAKECWEEAAIPADLAARAAAVGYISYCCETGVGLKPDTMYCYDLELPPDFVPRCTDGEVESFSLWPLAKVAECVRETDEFKMNCNLVIIDFLIRHGWLTDADPEYHDLVAGLRQERCS